MSDVETVNLIELFDFDKKQLGVILALLERGPSIVPQILAQLESEGGSLGQAVIASYNAADAELEGVVA